MSGQPVQGRRTTRSLGRDSRPNTGLSARWPVTITGMADRVDFLRAAVKLRDTTRLLGDARPDLRDVADGVVAELDRQIAAPPGDLVDSLLAVIDADEPMLKALGVEDYLHPPGASNVQAAANQTAKSLERAGISGLSAKDVLLLVLVALLLLHGGDGHPTALGEAVESNNLQVVAIIIAVAAYLRKRE